MTTSTRPVERGRPSRLRRARAAGHTVCFDIGHGVGVAPDGINYCLLFIDLATGQRWAMGLKSFTASFQ